MAGGLIIAANERSLITNNCFFRKIQTRVSAQLCNLASKHPIYVVQPTPGMNVNVPQKIVRSMMYKSEKIDVAIRLEEYRESEEK